MWKRWKDEERVDLGRGGCLSTMSRTWKGEVVVAVDSFDDELLEEVELEFAGAVDEDEWPGAAALLPPPPARRAERLRRTSLFSHVSRLLHPPLPYCSHREHNLQTTKKLHYPSRSHSLY